MLRFLPGQRLRFDYVNYRGEAETRDVIFKGLDFGANEWYPDPQWFMLCYDVARKAVRSFALAKIDANAIEIMPFGLLDAVEDLAGGKE